MAANEEFRPAEGAKKAADRPADHGDEFSAPEAELMRELNAIRPRPCESFRRHLDDRAAAGFPPRRGGQSDPDAAGGRRRPDRPRRSLRERLGLPASLRIGPVLAGAAVACAVAAAVVVSGPEQLRIGGGNDGGAAEMAATEGMPPPGAQTANKAAGARDAASADSAIAPEAPAASRNKMKQHTEEFAPATADRASGRPGDAIAASRNRRAVERGASMTLATEPSEVDEVASGVLRVVGTYGGIVMSSTTRGGLEGQAGAEFALKMPSARLGDALADLSDLAPVRHRSESSLDITAPTVTLSDDLREARAKVRGLLKQLAGATTAEEREAIEIDLAPAQARVARLRSQLDRLERRANFADVSVAIVTGRAGALPAEDEWTIGEAADDALRVLTVVGGVLLVAAAILAPIGLLLLTGWALRRVWLRHAREKALRQEGAGQH